MKRCVIVGGAPVGDTERARSYIREGDTVIFCDCALRHAGKLGRAPDIIVGDFDSYSPDEAMELYPDSRIIRLDPVKDDTDSSHAVTEALSLGFDDFVLLGMTGRRMDHSLGNIYLLYRLYLLGKKAMIADDFSEITIVGKETVYIDDSMPFFSLINICGKASGICVRNAKYPLEDAEIFQTANDLGISNEVLPGQTASVSVSEGCLLLVRDVTG